MSSGGYVQGGRIDADEEFERVLYTSGTIEWIYDTRFRKEKKVRERREKERERGLRYDEARLYTSGDTSVFVFIYYRR